MQIDDSFGLNEKSNMMTVARHYNYNLDLDDLKNGYKEGSISAAGMDFVRAVEFMLLRISEADAQCGLIHKRDENGKQKDRSRVLEQDIKVFRDAIHLLIKYSDKPEAEEYINGLTKCIGDIEQVQAGVKKGKKDIRYGYNNNLQLLNKRLDYLKNTEKFITEAISLHLDYLYNDLDQLGVDYSPPLLKQLFKYYIQP